MPGSRRGMRDPLYPAVKLNHVKVLAFSCVTNDYQNVFPFFFSGTRTNLKGSLLRVTAVYGNSGFLSLSETKNRVVFFI